MLIVSYLSSFFGFPFLLSALKTKSKQIKTKVVLDLKGCQYRGKLYPGPTVMVLSTVNKKVGESKQERLKHNNKTQQPQLKVDAMTDEFLHLVKTGNAMDMLSAVVQGNMGDDYRVRQPLRRSRGLG